MKILLIIKKILNILNRIIKGITMKDKVIVFLSVVVVIAGYLLNSQIERIAKMKSELLSANSNVSVLMKESEKYLTQTGLWATRVDALQLTVSDLLEYRQKDAAVIKDLKIKIKNITSFQKTTTQTNTAIDAPVIYVPINDTIYPCVSDTGLHHIINGCFVNKRFKANITSFDTTYHVGDPTYKGWWIFKKITGARITTIHTNPDVITTSNEYILFKKK